jgi:hypothetical protein
VRPTRGPDAVRNDRVEAQAPSVPRRRSALVLVLLAALAAAGAVPLVAGALRDPVHVDRVAVENPSPWRVNVAVSDAGQDGWLLLGPVDPEEVREFHDVVDQGEKWTFRFSYDGHVAVADVTRADLAAAGWQVPLPDTLAAELEASDEPETPR